MKAASLIRIGMPADDVPKMRGRGYEHFVNRPTMEGNEFNDGGRYIIAWHYEDCDVILHHRQGCYRVKEVRNV